MADDIPPGAKTLDGLVRKSHAIDYENDLENFVATAYDLARLEYGGGGAFGEALAALFDLAVTALYLEKVPNTNWIYCNRGATPTSPTVYYPFVNTCPRCLFNGEFRFVPSRKPQSANIGLATSTILSTFLDMQAYYTSNGNLSVRTLNDNGLVDAILIGEQEISLFEIKSAPLLSFPLEAQTALLTDLDPETNETRSLPADSQVVVPQGIAASLMVDPKLRINVGTTDGFKNRAHYRVILNWLRQEGNLSRYVESWTQTFRGYSNPAQRGVTHWLTNGCGSPRPRPDHWPQRSSGQGFETISDGKSSVGLDRTDDVKKGIYQVLKISTHYKEYFPSAKWRVTAALVTNIHAVKHHEDYLSQLEDMIWTVDGPGRSHVIERNESKTTVETSKLYNLFDALVSFTKPHFRDPFLERIYDFD